MSVSQDQISAASAGRIQSTRKTEAGTGASSGTTVGASNSELQSSLHSRFSGDATQSRMFDKGGFMLSSRHNGETVQAVQQALVDLGYSMPRFGADGSYGGETAAAPKDFQRDHGLNDDGLCGRDTIRALGTNAPAGGTQTERFLDYGKLLADGKIEVTVAFGHDDEGIVPDEIVQFRRWVTDQGFEPTAGKDGGSEYYQRSYELTNGGKKQNATVVLRVITPSATAKDSYMDALANDEVTYYAGAARYGSGHDFDDHDSAEGNFVLGVNSKGHENGTFTKAYNADQRRQLRGRGNDLEKMSSEGKLQKDKYQDWAFGACSTVNYLDELRGGLVKDKDASNLDVLGTGQPIYLVNEADATIAFLEGLIKQASVQQVLADMNKESPEAQWWQNGAGGNPTQK